MSNGIPQLRSCKAVCLTPRQRQLVVQELKDLWFIRPGMPRRGWLMGEWLA